MLAMHDQLRDTGRALEETGMTTEHVHGRLRARTDVAHEGAGLGALEQVGVGLGRSPCAGQRVQGGRHAHRVEAAQVRAHHLQHPLRSTPPRLIDPLWPTPPCLIDPLRSTPPCLIDPPPAVHPTLLD